MLAADIRACAKNDQETQRLPTLRDVIHAAR